MGLIRKRAKIKARSTKFKKTNADTNLERGPQARGGLFYMQKDLFDSPDTLDYASVVFPSRYLVLEGS